MQSDCEKIDHLTGAPHAERNEINYANIIKAYITHVLCREGTHFLYFDRDFEALSLSNAEAAELARLRDEVDAAWEQR